MVEQSKLRKACNVKNFTLSHKNPHLFFQSQWQSSDRVSNKYLIYRWIHFLIYLLCLLFSLVNFRRSIPHGQNPTHFYLKWIIYATHWSMLLCVGQALLAVYLITRRKLEEMKQEKVGTPAETIVKMTILHKTYWCLHTMAVTVALCISLVYWTTVYKPEKQGTIVPDGDLKMKGNNLTSNEHSLDIVNIMVHVLNSLFMLIDVLIVAHPTKLLHFYMPLSYQVTYALFTVVYFLAGGLDRSGKVTIYSSLNWNTPGPAVLYVAISCTSLIILHVVVFALSRLKKYIYYKLYSNTEQHYIY